MQNKGQVIFIHSMFRAGSTYMFNKFRSYDEFCTYYEPLHHDLIKLKKESLDIWKYDKKATDVMNHPELKKPHFYEYKTAFNDLVENLPFYDTDFAYKEFFKVIKDDELKNYITNIINTTSVKEIPVLQFNRTSCRIDWFKKNFSTSLNIFLLRNPRDQFESYYNRGDIEKNIFLAINLYILFTDDNSIGNILSQNIKFKFTNNINKDLSNCMEMCKDYTLNDHYKVFYYIWLKSFEQASKYSDFIIDMDEINKNKTSLKEIIEYLYDKTNVNIEFNDYNIKNNKILSIDNNSFNQIETYINSLHDLDSELNSKLKIYFESFNKNGKCNFIDFIKNFLFFGKKVK